MSRARRICITEVDAGDTPLGPEVCSTVRDFRAANVDTPHVWQDVKRIPVGACRVLDLGAGGYTRVCAVPVRSRR